MASLQTSYFILVGLILLTAGRFGGSPAVLMTVTGLVGISGQMSALILLKRSTPSEHVLPQLGAARDLAASWGVRLPRVLVVNHTDPGFTGGITRLGWQLTIVVPRLWVQQLSSEGLACILARRALAIESGGYARGVAVAMSWILSGVALATLLPGGGFTTVAQVATSFGYFTLWSFLGLLWMPSWSRQAILELDRRLLQRDVPADLLQRTAHQLDRWQDDEPHRSAWLESVFHPIPAANNRGRTGGETGWLIWNPARQTLIASWGCAGLLARAVHCNLGRPELWLMLPSD